MDSLIEILTNYGYVGMLISAFLAGSIFPLSSEVVMLALLAAGLDPWQLVIYGTIGNVLGSMLNYGIGMLGRIDWIEKYLHVNKKELDRAKRFMAGRGAWMGFFSFLPVIGEGITIVLGLMRSNVAITVISVIIENFCDMRSSSTALKFSCSLKRRCIYDNTLNIKKLRTQL